MAEAEAEVRKLQDRIQQLETELAEARAARQEQERLHANEERFRHVLLAAPFPLLIRREDGKVVMINRAWTEFSGYSLEDIPDIYEWTRKAYGEQALERQALNLGEGFTDEGPRHWGEFEITTRTGEKRTWDFTSVPLSVDEDGKRLALTMAVDITERKRTEQQLQENEEKFAIMFEKAPFAAALSKLPEGRLVNVNEAFERAFGYSREESLGRTTLELGINPDEQARARTRDQVQEHGRARNVESVLHTRSGERRVFSINIDMVSIGGEKYALQTAQDITERRKTEEALRISEERFARAFHASPEAILISRLEDGLIVEMNEGWTAMFGHEEGDVLGKTTIDLGIYVDPNDRMEAIRLMDGTGSLRDFELQVRTKTGEIREASMSAEIMEANGIRYLLTIMRDITERKRTREHLAYQARLLASVNDAIVGSDAEYRVTAWNPVAEAMYGWKAEEVLGRNGLDVLQTSWPESDAEEMRLRIAEKGSWRGEATQRRKDGTRIPVEMSSIVLHDKDGKLAGYVSVNRDITERKIAERALRESEARFRSLADSMPQLVWTARPDGSVDYYNQRYREYQEIKPAEDATWEWAPVVHPDDLELTMDAWGRAVETGESYQVEHRIRMKDGSYRWHLSRGVPMQDEEGQVIRWFGTATDIHDLKQAEQALQDYAGRLERSNRDLQEFAYMASHDLQEPLRKVEAFGAALNETSEGLSGKQRDYINRMRNAAGRMRSMVDGLLALSRVERGGQPSATADLEQIARDVVSTLELPIRASGGRVEIGSLPRIQADPVQMQQLLQNLVGNALKFHPKDVPPEVRVDARTRDGWVELSVQDNGIGFEQSEAERIFQPFQRLVGRSEYEGSGMGLAICRKIVERHHGTIRVQSTPGRGSTFLVRLPVRQPVEPNTS